MPDRNLPTITRLYRACEPLESLRPDDPRWVDFDEVRGEETLVQQYARSLRRTAPTSSCSPGIGAWARRASCIASRRCWRNPKPTTNRRGFVVVFCDVGDRLDVNDLDFPDLPVFVAGQLQAQLREARLPGFDPVAVYLRRVWEEIRSLLGSEVELEDVEADAGFGKLALELRNRPNARKRLRDAVEQHSSSLLDALNDLLDDARTSALRTGHAGLVLVIDGLDKLVLRTVEDGGNTHERLFVDRSEQLASLKVHTVYTVPISLIYSPRFSQLEQAFGEHNAPVSMIRLRDGRDGEITDETPGMVKMRELVEKRCDCAGTSTEEAFDDVATLNDLCRMSGGHPRHLLMFLQAALNEIDALPITQEAARKAVRKYGNSLLREIPDPAWGALKAFDRPQPDIPKDPLHQELLFLLFVFEYMNGEMWYEINPVIRELDRFHR